MALLLFCDTSTDNETIANTSGRAIAGTQVAIMSADGEHLPAGATGEILYTRISCYERFILSNQKRQLKLLMPKVGYIPVMWGMLMKTAI